jgi:5-methylcytosine-specific restriction enzyme A
MAPDREGNQRSAIVFELRPLAALVEEADEAEADAVLEPPKPIGELRALAKAAAILPGSSPSVVLRNVYQRSRDVRNYVLARANGSCEGCEASAPFVRRDGSPYLEPHHIRRRSDGGPDAPAYVIALCPNCHRRVHAGNDGVAYNAELLTKLSRIEAS